MSRSLGTSLSSSWAGCQSHRDISGSSPRREPCHRAPVPPREKRRRTWRTRIQLLLIRASSFLLGLDWFRKGVAEFRLRGGPVRPPQRRQVLGQFFDFLVAQGRRTKRWHLRVWVEPRWIFDVAVHPARGVFEPAVGAPEIGCCAGQRTAAATRQARAASARRSLRSSPLSRERTSKAGRTEGNTTRGAEHTRSRSDRPARPVPRRRSGRESQAAELRRSRRLCPLRLCRARTALHSLWIAHTLRRRTGRTVDRRCAPVRPPPTPLAAPQSPAAPRSPGATSRFRRAESVAAEHAAQRTAPGLQRRAGCLREAASLVCRQ